MKRCLNNVYKGRRLVTGDENELTSHELLLKEEDNKIVVKGRGDSGEVETLSGGPDLASTLRVKEINPLYGGDHYNFIINNNA